MSSTAPSSTQDPKQARERVARVAARRPSLWYALICVPWILGVVLSLNSSRTHDKIAARQQTTAGRITAHEPSNHDRYGYAFSVGGKDYSGWEIPQRSALQIGQTVTVYYDSTDPSTSALTAFGKQSADDTGPVPLLMLGSLGIVVLTIYQWRRRRFF